MIDLHSHILPAIDDGAADLRESMKMARMAVGDGISCMACTPHIIPGLWANTAQSISSAMHTLQERFEEDELDLRLVLGADVHIAPDLLSSLDAGHIPTLNGTRYFLFEPTHRVLPPRIEDLATQLIVAGYVPILTHPERLTWLEHHYDTIERLNQIGCLLQIAAGSITGAFGKTALYYAERLLDEGRVDILASDAHNVSGRPPILSAARDSVAERLDEAQAIAMVMTRPAQILADESIVPQGQRNRVTVARKKESQSLWKKLMRKDMH